MILMVENCIHIKHLDIYANTVDLILYYSFLHSFLGVWQLVLINNGPYTKNKTDIELIGKAVKIPNFKNYILDNKYLEINYCKVLW